MNQAHTFRQPHLLLALLSAAALAACSSTPLEDNKAPVESRSGSAVTGGSGGAGASGTAQSRVAPVDLAANDGASMGNLARIIYFDFDSYVVKDDFRATVEANAKVLTGNRTRKASIEGHTDERGGREYNLALGQKRAEAVARSLTLLGATATQLEAVSFGEERPAATGSDEAAWAKNRRAEITYR
jgi:peptidoglycan-associated lipoprotein